ncbi:hypothetical protein J6590_082488 [Homalodisca vitripennis]|nr:hypothetical protein J6590_082488 [Homalodisca vitripennis]
MVRVLLTITHIPTLSCTNSVMSARGVHRDSQAPRHSQPVVPLITGVHEILPLRRRLAPPHLVTYRTVVSRFISSQDTLNVTD